MKTYRVKRLIPKWFLWLAICINACFIVAGLLWLTTKFDIPFVNSGDKTPVLVVALVWWVLTSFAIFGWKVEKK